jgi:hypothetical protein
MLTLQSNIDVTLNIRYKTQHVRKRAQCMCDSPSPTSYVGLAQTVHEISMYCIYAVFPYIPYMRGYDLFRINS